MSYEARKAIITKLQKARNGHVVITYITTTRPNVDGMISMDAINKINRQLELIKTPKADTIIDLFLHTNGGESTVPWRLVTLIREYCSEFNVIVPYRCFSAGTLTALGADSIVMHRMGMLGPVDPKVINEFNPQDPANPQNKLGINVEDVFAYISLVKDDVGITHEDELIAAFNQLAKEDRVHPLALGNVKRFYAQARMMAVKLLELHMDPISDEHRIKEIADKLNAKLFFHGHPINREEAKSYHLKVESASPTLEKIIWELYKSYALEMRLEDSFNPQLEFRQSNPVLAPIDLNTNRGKIMDFKNLIAVYIESDSGSDRFEIDIQLEGYRVLLQQANNTYIAQDQINVNQMREEWISV